MRLSAERSPMVDLVYKEELSLLIYAKENNQNEGLLMLIRLLFISFLFLLSCNNNDSKSSGGGVDQSLPDFTKDFKSKNSEAKPLTPQLKQRASQFFKSTSKGVSLIQIAFNDFSSEGEKNQILQNLNEENKTQLESLNKFCKIKPWSTSKKSLFTDQSPSEERSIVDGGSSKCPLSHIEKRQQFDEVTQAENGNLTGTRRLESGEETVAMSSAIKKERPFASVKSYQTVNSLLTNVKFSEDKQTAGIILTLLSRKTEVVMASDSSTIKETTSTEVIAGPQSVKSQTLMTIKFPEGDLYLYIESISNNSQYFVNGESYSRDQLNKEFNLILE